MLLQHFAVATNQHHSHMTLFLKLFKHYKPKVNYNDLPSTGKTLLKVSPKDFGVPNCKEKKLPPVIHMGKSGKYVHFGLEKGIEGNSPGVVFKNAGLLQFVSVYKEDPLLLPICIREQVNYNLT